MADFLGYKNKRVVVSGCFSGMGEATTKMLLDLGAEVHGRVGIDWIIPEHSVHSVDRFEQILPSDVPELSQTEQNYGPRG